MKIMTYNVNGIRAAMNKGFLDFLKSKQPDMLCLQEIKATPDQFPVQEFENLGYHCIWNPAVKKGYSGTALLSKIKPNKVSIGCGHELFDAEGRVIRADFDRFSVFSTYFPSGTSGDIRQELKMHFLDYYFEHLKNLKNELPGMIVCGDYNICHKPIDIHDPVSNKNSSGFLPEEREWMDKFFDSGFIDTFRQFNPEPQQYSWWSYRAGARARNKGWRIDYISVTPNLKDLLADAALFPDENHSDHCAVSLELK
jgi:exodeoxyribonuclease III